MCCPELVSMNELLKIFLVIAGCHLCAPKLEEFTRKSAEAREADHRGRTRGEVTLTSTLKAAQTLSALSQCGTYFVVSDTLLVTK